MQEPLNAFLSRVPRLAELSASEMIDYFVYYLTVIKGNSAVGPADIDACAKEANLAPLASVRQYLWKKAQRGRGTKPKFVRTSGGYRLERFRKEELDKTLGVEPIARDTSKALRDLLRSVSTRSEEEFLKEAIDCYEIRAFRAAIVMGWILTLDHLYEYVLAHALTQFNAELSKVNDRRVRVSIITKKDDFSDIPEIRLIELLRAANVISNDVRKILDVKLGIRNSSAHPSGIAVSSLKASEFLHDLVSNVISKYSI